MKVAAVLALMVAGAAAGVVANPVGNQKSEQAIRKQFVRPDVERKARQWRIVMHESILPEHSSRRYVYSNRAARK